MAKTDNNQPEVIKCEWCEKEITPDTEKVDQFLTGVFGYVYCSEECMEDHICSK